MSELLLPSPKPECGPYVSALCLAETIMMVRDVVAEVRNISLATTDPDGDPHITVLLSGFEVPPPTAEAEDQPEDGGFLPTGECVWWSYDTSDHSRNLARRPTGKAAVYNSHENKPALIAKMRVRRLSYSETAIHGLLAYNTIRRHHGIDPRPLHEFSPHEHFNPKALYVGTPIQLSVGVPALRLVGDRYVTHGEVQYPVTAEQVWSHEPLDPALLVSECMPKS